MMRFCRTKRSTVRATRTTPTLAQRLIGVDDEPLSAGIRHDFERLRHQIGKAHRLDHMIVARRAHQFASTPIAR